MGSAFSKCCQADDAAQSFLSNNPGTFPTSKNTASREHRGSATGATRVTEPETPTGQNMILGMLKERNERSLPQVQTTSGECDPSLPRGTSAPSTAGAAGADEAQNNFVSYPTSSGKDTPKLKGTDSPFLERTAQSSDGAGIVVVTCIDQSPALSSFRSSSGQQDQSITPIARVHLPPETVTTTSPNSKPTLKDQSVKGIIPKEHSPSKVPESDSVATVASTVVDSSTTPTPSPFLSTDNEPCCNDCDSQESGTTVVKTEEPELKNSEAVISCDVPAVTAATIGSPPVKKGGKGSKAQSDAAISAEVAQPHSPTQSPEAPTRTKKLLTPSKPRPQASSTQVPPTSFLSDGQPVSSTSSPALIATLAPIRTADDTKNNAGSTVISANDFESSPIPTDALAQSEDPVLLATLAPAKQAGASTPEVIKMDSADVPVSAPTRTPAKNSNSAKKTKLPVKPNSPNLLPTNDAKVDTEDSQAPGSVSVTPVKNTGKAKAAEANGEKNSVDGSIPNLISSDIQTLEELKTESNDSALVKPENAATSDGKAEANVPSEPLTDDLNSSSAKSDEANAKKKKPRSGRKSKRGGAN